MGTLPLVSISCITYNHVNFIRQCLDGFLMQQCNFDFEVLIHDDASTDGTSRIIIEYQKKYPSIIKPVIQCENQWSKGVRGISIKYNIPRATGKYIAFCEGDDYWTDPLKLQKQVDFLEANPDYVICSHSYDYNRIDGNEIITKSVPPSNYVINKYDGFDFKLNDLCRYSFLYTLSNLVRSDAIKDLHLPKKYAYLRDVHLNYHLLKGGKKGFYSNESMAFYRKHSGGVHSSSEKWSQDKLRVAICKEIYLLNQKSFYTICKYVSAKSILLSTALLSKKSSKVKSFKSIVHIYYLLFILLFYSRGGIDFIVYKKEHSHMIRSAIRFFASLFYIKI